MIWIFGFFERLFIFLNISFIELPKFSLLWTDKRILNLLLDNFENFDLSFLNGELRTANRKLIEEDNIIDSLEMARLKFPGASNSLDSLCKRFNVDLSRRVKHNALLDCELLREVYINLLDAKEPKFNLTSDNFDQNIVINKSYYKNILQISENEIKAHKDFIKKELKKNFYWIDFIEYNFSKSTFSLILISLNPEASNKFTKIFLNSG